MKYEYFMIIHVEYSDIIVILVITVIIRDKKH